ncbi:MAG: hypothetical protein ACRC8S_10005 [Fimbriiglobus sp.]
MDTVTNIDRPSKSEPIVLVVAPPEGQPEENPEAKPAPRRWTWKRLMFTGVTIALVVNAVCTHQGRECFCHHLQTHLPSALVYGAFMIAKRYELHSRFKLSNAEAEIQHEVRKAILESALMAILMALIATIW